MAERPVRRTSTKRRKVYIAMLLAAGVADLALINLLLAPDVVEEAAAASTGVGSPPVRVAQEVAASGSGTPRLNAPASRLSPGMASARGAQPTTAEPNVGATIAAYQVSTAAREESQQPPAAMVHEPWRVHFDSASEQLRSSDKHVLAQVVEAWKASGRPAIVVTGHADQRGEHASNSVLSRRRTEEVADRLRSLGIPLDAMSLAAKGDSEPLDGRLVPEAFAENRRVEIRFR